MPLTAGLKMYLLIWFLLIVGVIEISDWTGMAMAQALTQSALQSCTLSAEAKAISDQPGVGINAS